MLGEIHVTVLIFMFSNGFWPKIAEFDAYKEYLFTYRTDGKLCAIRLALGIFL